MDKHFLEFWGNFLINAAKGQKNLQDMSKWLDQNLSGFDDLTAMFRKFYGLDRLSEDNADHLQVWQNATQEFQQSFQDFLNLMGVVPQKEHLALINKYERLKKKVADQEETIKHLRLLLGDKGSEETELVKGFNDLIKKQSEQFQEVIQRTRTFFKEQTQLTDSDKKTENDK